MSFSSTSRPIFTIETISSAISLVKISVQVPRTSNTGQEIIPNAMLGNLSLSLLIRGGMIAALIAKPAAAILASVFGWWRQSAARIQ